MPLRLPSPEASASHDAHSFDMSDAPARRVSPQPSFVSAGRVHQVLRTRFGSRSTGQRGPGFIYWQTANGVLFPLEDPLAVPGSRSVVRADGREQLYYSYAYVVTLLRRVDEAERAAHAQRRAENAGRGEGEARRN